MFKLILTLFLLAFVIGGSSAATAQTATQWIGSYTFGENGGRTAGGSAIYVGHELTVNNGKNGLTARLQSNGYQTSIDLNGTVKIEGNKLHVYFDNYGENNVYENYQKGDLLLTLERKKVAGKNRILTFWGKFKPVVLEAAPTGKVYFEKS